MEATEHEAPETPALRRSWLQFNLRTLVIVMLLAGLVLGRYGIRRLEIARERAALAELQHYGADVQFHDGRAVGVSFSGEMFHDEALAGLDRLPRLQRLVLIDTSVSDAGLRRLADLENLEQLLLLNARVTDEGVSYVARLRNLRTLRLDHTQITDRGLRHLSGLNNLRRLDLAGTRVSDEGLKHLAGMPQLEQINLHGAQVTEEGVQSLQQRLPGVTILR